MAILSILQIQIENSKKYSDRCFPSLSYRALVFIIGKVFYLRMEPLDLKNIKAYKKERIEDSIENGKITYLGRLEEEIINRLEESIENAVTLPSKDKKHLLCKQNAN